MGATLYGNPPHQSGGACFTRLHLNMDMANTRVRQPTVAYFCILFLFIFLFFYFSAEYPFINYYVIHKTRDEAAAIFREAHNAFFVDKTGYCSATFDKYEIIYII